MPSRDHAETRSAWPLVARHEILVCGVENLPRRYGPRESTSPQPHPPRCANGFSTSVTCARVPRCVTCSGGAGGEVPSRDHAETRSAWPLLARPEILVLRGEELPRRYGSRGAPSPPTPPSTF